MAWTYKKRRYYRAKADAAQTDFSERGERDPIAALHEQRREATPPEIVMAVDFPYRARLITAGYSAIDELIPATERELMGKGFKRAEARAILKAVADAVAAAA